jgi:hypothetical protein
METLPGAPDLRDANFRVLQRIPGKERTLDIDPTPPAGRNQTPSSDNGLEMDSEKPTLFQYPSKTAFFA